MSTVVTPKENEVRKVDRSGSGNGSAAFVKWEVYKNGSWIDITNSKDLQKYQAMYENQREAWSGNTRSNDGNDPNRGKTGSGPAWLTPTGGVSSTATTALKYPNSREIGANTDYISFQFEQYDPPFGKGIKLNEKGEVTRGLQNTSKESTNNWSGLYDAYNDNQGDTPGMKAKGFQDVILYMPEDVQAQYGANWGGVGLTTGMANTLRLSGDGLNASSFGNTWESKTGGSKAAGFGFLSKIVNAGRQGTLTGDQAMGSVTGTILNPNTELMYESPEMRGFNLNFKMVARDQPEATAIRTICNQFKKCLLPHWGGTTVHGLLKSGALLSIPHIVKVSFMQGNKLNPYVSQFKKCAITSVNINYTPDGSYATYKDGSPVSTMLSLQFKELKLIFAGEIAAGASPNGKLTATY